MKKPAEVLAMIISAIKNLREMKGSTTREILHYISSVYDIPATVARRQTQAALKRGVAYGILRKNRGHYVLPTNEQMQGQEVAAQEIDLVNLFRNKVTERGGRGCKRRRHSRRSGRSRRKCKCKRTARSRRRRSRGCKRRRKRRKCKCGGIGRSRGRSYSATASPKKTLTDEIPVNTTNDKNDKDEDEPASENSSTSTLTSVEQ